MTRVCVQCDVEKSVDKFDGNRKKCRKCRQAGRTGRKQREKALKYLYGITLPEYDFLLYAQDGVCAICEKPPLNDRWKSLAVDHDHETGAVRGLLCGYCNRGIGQLRDSLDLCRRAAAYLEATV